MKKFIKFLIGLFLLPLCWAFSRTVYLLLRALPAASSWTEWALPAGFLLSVAGFFLLPKPFRTYVLGHELTHAVSGLLMGAKVGRMKVGEKGGHVMMSKSSFIISLAPYVFPFYTGLVILLWYAAGWFVDLNPYRPWWLAAVGMTWGFHVTFTVYMLGQSQPDVLENGRLFSYVLIYLTNLFFVAVWIILVGSPVLDGVFALIRSETVAAYMAAWNGAQSLWQAASQWIARAAP
jgi:hypothetical protein